MKEQELTGSSRIAGEAIEAAKDRLDANHITAAWFVLAYAALRILAKIADKTSELSEAVDHHAGCIVTRPAEY